MTTIAFQNGHVVVRQGQVGTGQDCCCKCGKCLRDGPAGPGTGPWDCQYTTQEQCEDCIVTTYCVTVDPETEETTVTVVDDCSQCDGVQCYQTREGTCGTWVVDTECPQFGLVCCESCLPACTVTHSVTDNTANYTKGSSLVGLPDTNYVTVNYNQQWLDSHVGCTLFWVWDQVSQTNATGTFCANHPVTGLPTYSIRSWWRYRLFTIDCRTKAVTEVTAEALTQTPEAVFCQVPSFNNQLLCAPNCAGANPGFINDIPTLVCP